MLCRRKPFDTGPASRAVPRFGAPAGLPI